MENMETQNATVIGQENQQAGTEPGKTFTQEEVNRIVQERLARVKTSPEPDEREQALQQRENVLYAREQIAELGLPRETLEDFKGMDRETIDKCIKIIAPYAQKASEPILNQVGPTSGTGEAGSDSAIRAAMGAKEIGA